MLALLYVLLGLTAFLTLTWCALRDYELPRRARSRAHNRRRAGPNRLMRPGPRD